MNPIAGYVSQRCIDHALPLQSRCTGEYGALNLDGEMRFAAAIVACMAAVARRIVDHGELGGVEGGAKQRFDFLCKWSCHDFTSSASVAM